MRVAAGASLFVLLIAVLATSQQNRVVPKHERPPNDPRAFEAGNPPAPRNARANFGAAKGQAAPTAKQQGIFFEAPQYAAGPSGVVAMAMGDFNRDGHMDLAVANVANSVSVVLGNSDGTFQAPRTYPAGTSPASIAVGDFNGDGKLDLAVANSGGASVSVLLGNGDGTFQAHVDYATGAGPQSVAVGDFNGDGKPDLVTADGSGVSVLLGNGDGTFTTHVEYATAGPPSSVAVGDFNGDGKLDLVTGNGFPSISDRSDSVSVLLGNGDGTFRPHVDYTVGNGLYNPLVAVGDFNEDGKLDLAVSLEGPNGNPENNTAEVLIGNGDGTFQTPSGLGGLVSGPAAIAVGDLNGDGHLDLAVSVAGFVNVLFGNGDGTFQPSVVYTAGGSATGGGVVVWDFNGDGSPDLAVLTTCANPSSSCQAGAVAILFGNSDGSLQASVDYGLGTGSDWVAVADFNHDGKPDLVTAGGGSVTVFLGNGNGTFQSFVDYRTGASGNLGWESVAVEDFNGDGKPDLVVAPGSHYNGGGTNSVEVLLGNGDGTFQSSTAYQVAEEAMSVAFGDFNGDGKLDLAVAHLCSLLSIDPTEPLRCESNGSVGVLLGHGDGTFGEEVTYGGVGLYPVSVAVGDFNLDGKLDLVLSDGGNFYILLGAGDGTFGASQSYGSGASGEPGDGGAPFPQSVVVADFNGDGKPDLAVSNSGGPVAVSLGNGDGTFQASQIYGAGKASQSVAVGDFNGDGKLDLVAADGGVVSLLLGNGDGTFQPELNYAGAGGNAGGTSLAVGDFNGDGALDLVTEGVSVLLNRRGTLINVQSSNNPSMFGQTVEFTVTVAAGLRGTGSPTGTVTVRDGATVLGSGALVSGKFVVSTSSLAAGSHRIFAKYSGDCNFQKHTSEALIQTVQQTVQKIPSGTALNSSANPSDFNESVTFTSTVTPDAVTKPSGSVTFWDGTTKLGAGSLNASGSVSFTVSTLTAGKHNITGSYSGDGNFTASMSAAVSQVVNDFQSTASAPTPASVVPGQSATATVTVGPLGGFNIPISLTCSVSPMPALAPTCALDPTSVTPVAGKSTSSTLTIKTTAFSASLTSPSLQRDSRPLYVLCLPIAGLLLFGVASPLNPSRRRKLLGFLAGAALLSGLLFQFACGGGSAINNSSAGTPAGNYTVTINATSGSMAHTTTVTLKVQ